MFDWNNLNCKLISGDFSVGDYVDVMINDKIYKHRKVYDGPDDLYIRIKGYRFFFSDFF